MLHPKVPFWPGHAGCMWPQQAPLTVLCCAAAKSATTLPAHDTISETILIVRGCEVLFCKKLEAERGILEDFRDISGAPKRDYSCPSTQNHQRHIDEWQM